MGDGMVNPAFAFGRIAAEDGWSLDSARHLGAITGYDPDDVETDYRSYLPLARTRCANRWGGR